MEEVLREYLKDDMFPVKEVAEAFVEEMKKAKKEFIEGKKDLPLDNDLMLKSVVLKEILINEGIKDIEGYIKSLE